MSRYPLKLPVQLKQDAERWARKQGASLNRFPQVSYRSGASHQSTPVVRGTRIRVQTLVVSALHWEMSVQEMSEEYGLATPKIEEALAFYEAHRAEINRSISAEQELETAST